MKNGLNTAVSGLRCSSHSRMFLGGKTRTMSEDQPFDKTFVAFHGNYANDEKLLKASMARLKAWVVTYSDSKANPNLVEQ